VFGGVNEAGVVVVVAVVVGGEVCVDGGGLQCGLIGGGPKGVLGVILSYV